LATRFGVKATQLVHEQKFGRMVALSGSKLHDVAIEEATSSLKTLDMELYRVAEVFFG
jgi:6-phosphofructokinase 1